MMGYNSPIRTDCCILANFAGSIIAKKLPEIEMNYSASEQAVADVESPRLVEGDCTKRLQIMETTMFRGKETSLLQGYVFDKFIVL